MQEWYEHAPKWYEHAPEGAVENEEGKILWDAMIQCDRKIKARKPNIVVVNKNGRSCAIIDIAIPGDIRVREKEKEKVIPVVVGTLGSTSKKLKNCIEKLGVVLSTAFTVENSTIRDSWYIKEDLYCL